MTTATKTKKDGLQKVKAAEAAWAAAEDAWHAESARHADLLRRHQDLDDKRRRLVHADPELVDHLNVPVGPDNPVGKLDQERGKLDDPTESAARVEHRKQVARSKGQAREDLIRHNAEAIRQEAYTDDETLRSSFIEVMTKAHEIARQRVDVRRKLMGVNAICHESTHGLGIDAAADTERTVRQLAENPPAPAGGE